MEVLLRDRAWVKGPTAPVLKGEEGVWYAEERMAGCGNRSCEEVAPALSVEGQFGLRAFLMGNLISNSKI